MTFVAYKAGRGSVKKWVERYDDPRDLKEIEGDFASRRQRRIGSYRKASPFCALHCGSKRSRSTPLLQKSPPPDRRASVY
jgi:hypothetical protein